MNNYEPWIITAREYLEVAKLALGAGYHGPAYFNAAHSGELALKSLLVNLGFLENSIKGHNEIDLFDRIKSSGKYTKELIEKIESLIKPFAEGPFYNIPYTDVGFDNGERKADICDQGQAKHTKYPKYSVAPCEYLDEGDADIEITLCEKLIGLIEDYFPPGRVL